MNKYISKPLKYQIKTYIGVFYREMQVTFYLSLTIL